MYKTARKQAGLTIEEAAWRLHIHERTLAKYESGDLIPKPETVLAMSRVYNTPALSAVYCRQVCAIGQEYCYDVLNNVDLSPSAILSKYRIEEREVRDILEHLSELLLNKRGKSDCTKQELDQIRCYAHELLDLEHVIETLKLRLWDFLNVADLVREHNHKCERKRYVDKQKPALVMAG